MIQGMRCLRERNAPAVKSIKRTFAISRIILQRKEKKDDEYPFQLPLARLRALTTLYHQASTFITPANLSYRIDEAFTKPQNTTMSGTQYFGYEELESDVKKMRSGKANMKTYYKGAVLEFGGKSWSEYGTGRSREVGEALWGVYSGGRPDIETVLEVKALNEKESKLLAGTETGGSEAK